MASRRTRTKEGATNQTARCSPSSNARDPDQHPVELQANKTDINSAEPQGTSVHKLEGHIFRAAFLYLRKQ